ncbi:uncharacterized protein LOC132057081 [Lycium ferocissimum]|uniref:uncharacterized protein LOC132057081 n=1 Tax=Lycium ferocissimum TaxID=112874 RepID=UPI00281658B4|nr:uncharacterized protein LOC132057081 [Lycium ferocissimum]XP_059305503.1 uncharacterized protein LOC132057081 [Lycium ferocissimum]
MCSTNHRGNNDDEDDDFETPAAPSKQGSIRRIRSQAKQTVKSIKAGKRKAENANENGKKKKKKTKVPALAEKKVGEYYLEADEHFQIRISCHTNTEIVSILKQYLTETQQQMFRDSFFGYFFELLPFNNQNQLIYVFLLKEIAPNCEKET